MASKCGEAVQMVDCDSGNVRLKLDVLLPILEKVGDIPLTGVSINGPARTGKSSLLNYFLRYYSSEGDENWINKTLTEEFEWKSSSESQTGGILVWSEPFFLNKDGRKIAVLLMETQVDFVQFTDFINSLMICELSYRLSSVFIYNVKHQIDEDELLSRHIDCWLARILTQGLIYYALPESLVMLLRDWGNPMDYAYGFHDKNKPREKNFFKDKIEVKSDMEEDVKEVHDEVLRRYETVACCLLPKPRNTLESEDSTQSPDKDFMDAILKFVPRVGAAENLVLKTKDGNVITGHKMGVCAEYWNKQLEGDYHKNVKSSVKQNQMALSTAMDAYEKKMDAMKESNEGDKQPFEKVDKKVKEEAMMIFDKQKSNYYYTIDRAFRILSKTHIQMAFELYSNRAVQIVTMELGKVRIKLDALLPILEKVGDIPLAIISVNGPKRTGKSYILRHFLQFLATQDDGERIYEKLIKEYDWNCKTIGIFVWPKPFLMLKDGRQIAVLLMDTQGSFDENTDYHLNYLLFSLSCLLSSVFIYNIKQQRSEEVMQFLQLLLGFARMPLEDCISDPNLVVIIRDWQNPKDYLYGYHDKVVLDKPEETNVSKDILEARNHTVELNTHEDLNQMFAGLQPVCCLLPDPGLDKGFLDALRECVQRICAAENVTIKTIDDQHITGFDMVDVVKGWDGLITGILSDDMKSLANMASERLYETALFTALEKYTKLFDAKTNKYGFNEQVLEVVHDTAKKEAVVIFNQRKTVRNSCVEEVFTVKLEKEIQGVYERNIEINNILTKFYNLNEYSAKERLGIQQEVKSHVENVEKTLKEKAERERQIKVESEKRCKVEHLKQEWDKIKKQLIKRKMIREKIANEKKVAELSKELVKLKEQMAKEMKKSKK